MNNAARNSARWLLLSLPFTVALAFSGGFSRPFGAPKNATLAITTFALAALALMFSSRWKLGREEGLFWIAAAAYVLLNVVSAVMSKSRGMCLECVEWLVCGVLLCAAARATLSGDGRARNTRNLQIAISAAAVLMALLTVVQFFGMNALDALGLCSNSTGRMRMYATGGNPDFVATFLAVSLPGTTGLSIRLQRWRPLWISASVLIGVAIVLTGSRGGMIAGAAGIAVVALAAMGKRARVVVAAGIICALAAGTRLNPRTPLESLRGRAFIWQVSLSEGATRSAFGSGPGTFAYDYPLRLGQFFAVPGRDPLLRFAGRELHAQNDFVEAWHDTGWLGLVGLLALLGSWFVVAAKKLHESDNEGKPAVWAAIAGVTALCVAALFDFPMHRAETWALLWLAMAIPLVSPTEPPAQRPRLVWLRYGAAALLLITGSYSALAPLAASYEIAKGESDENQGRLNDSLEAYRAALRWEPLSPDASFDLTRAVARTGDYSGALAQSVIAMRSVNEPELHVLRARILENAGQDGEARRELEAAKRLFPYSAELRVEIESFPSPSPEKKRR